MTLHALAATICFIILVGICARVFINPKKPNRYV